MPNSTNSPSNGPGSSEELPVLRMAGITKQFPGVLALQDVFLEVKCGEVLALIGENGAGKSTLMKILGGIHRPDAGEIFIDGKPVAIHSVDDSIRHGIALIHQELNVLDNLDIAGNVFLGREPVWGGPFRLIDRKRILSETQTYLDRLGLKAAGSTPLKSLSIAEQQMVEIAKALSLKARILIMDEPTSSLTLTETERLFQVVKELRADGVSIIYISHRLGEIQVLADRVVALRDGANAGALARDEISHDRMVKLMVGRDLSQFYEHGQGSAGPASLNVEGLRTRRYPDRSVSFELRRGEILGFSGLVGAGRTEVAEALFGVEPATDGVVTIADDPGISIRSPQQAVSRGIYLVPEDRRHCGLVVELSIRENISLPGLSRLSRLGIVNRSRERDVAVDACKSLSVKAPNVEVIASNLSGGNQQKVVLAKWLALNPRVIIFDEPTRGIDVGAKAEIYKLMRELADKGVGVMMISSDMEEILGVSDRVVVMHEGALMKVLERSECNEEAIMKLAVGRMDE